MDSDIIGDRRTEEVLMAYIDFQELKNKLTMEQVADYLNLDLKPSGNQLRGNCPACNSDNPRTLAITPSKGMFYCFDAETGGDIIKLVAHVRGIKQMEAAQELTNHFDRKVTAPQPTRRETTRPTTFDPEAFGKKLVYSDEVEALGLNQQDAERLTIGFHPQRKMVYLPIRNMDGTIAGFIGCPPQSALKMPPQWLQSSVVPFRKKQA